MPSLERDLKVILSIKFHCCVGVRDGDSPRSDRENLIWTIGTVHSAAVTESQPRVRDDRYRRKVRGARQEEVALQCLSQGHSRTTSETLHNQTLSLSKTEFVRQTNGQKTPRN